MTKSIETISGLGSLSSFKFTILRRAIYHSNNYSIKNLKELVGEMEMADMLKLEEIHKRWIGY